MRPILGEVAAKAFNAVRLGAGAFPQFSGVNGQIDHMGTRTKSGQPVNAEGGLRTAAVWIATTVLADEISSLTWKLVSRDDKSRQPVQPELLSALWEEPNPDQTVMGWLATSTMSLALHGVSYNMLGWTKAGGLDVQWPIDPQSSKLERMDGGGLRLKVTGQGELENRPKDRPEFTYIPRYVLPGSIEPVSPIRMAAELVGLAQAYDEAAARLAGRGFAPSAVLTSGEPIDQTIATELSNRLERLHGGSANAGKVAVIGGKDLKLERFTMSMVDAQFLEQEDRVFNTLMAMWRIPPTVAGMVDKPSTWGSGIAEFSRGLERFTLRPLVQLIQAGTEKHVTRWVDPSLQYRGKFEALLSATPKERMEIQRLALMHGLTSQERVLAQNDEPPFDDDETVYTPLALAQEEDRALQRLRLQADAYVSLVAAGVEPSDAARETGFDPARLRNTEPVEA